MENRLKYLENIFIECGYSKETIEEIKHLEGAIETEDFIDNLENEKDCWEE